MPKVSTGFISGDSGCGSSFVTSEKQNILLERRIWPAYKDGKGVCRGDNEGR